MRNLSRKDARITTMTTQTSLTAVQLARVQSFADCFRVNLATGQVFVPTEDRNSPQEQEGYIPTPFNPQSSVLRLYEILQGILEGKACDQRTAGGFGIKALPVKERNPHQSGQWNRITCPTRGLQISLNTTSYAPNLDGITISGPRAEERKRRLLSRPAKFTYDLSFQMGEGALTLDMKHSHVLSGEEADVHKVGTMLDLSVMKGDQKALAQVLAALNYPPCADLSCGAILKRGLEIYLGVGLRPLEGIEAEGMIMEGGKFNEDGVPVEINYVHGGERTSLMLVMAGTRLPPRLLDMIQRTLGATNFP